MENDRVVRTLTESPIARQQHTSLVIGLNEQIIIADVGLVARVVAKEAEPGSQRAEHGITRNPSSHCMDIVTRLGA